MEGAFVARPSAWRLSLLLALSLGFVALGLWMAGLLGEPPNPNRTWIGWLSIIFFGACGVATLARLRDRRVQIVVDRNGMLWRQWSDSTIPWEAIRGVERRQIQRQSFLCLHLHDRAAYPSTRLLGRMAALSRGMGFGDISVTVTGTDRKLDELEDAVVREYQAWLERQGREPGV